MRYALSYALIFLLALTFLAKDSLAQPFAYISNHGDDTVSIINTATDVNQLTVNVCENPNGVAVTPDGSDIYIACDPPGEDGFISRIDPNSLFSVDTIEVGDELEAIAVSPDGTRVYATNSINGSNDQISVVDGVSFTPITQIDVDRSFFTFSGIVVSPDGMLVYASADADNDGEEDAIVVIDANTNMQIGTIELGSSNSNPNGIAISPDGRFIYTAHDPFNANGFVTITDTQNGNSMTTVSLGNRDGTGIAVSPDGNTLYVTSSGNRFGGPSTPDTLSVIELDNGNMVTNISLGGRNDEPIGVSVTPNGLKVYAAEEEGNEVYVSNALNNANIIDIAVGDDPRAFGIFIPSDPIVFDNDLAVVKSGFPNPVEVNGQLVYSVFVTNFGNIDATNVTLVDTLSPDVAFVSATPNPECTQAAGVVTCDLGTLEPGDIEEITITVAAPADPGTVLNVVEVFYDQEINEGTPLDNRAQIVTDVIPPPPPTSTSNLSITKAAPGLIIQGLPYEYKIEVTNLGPDLAQNVMVRDFIPEDVMFTMIPPDNMTPPDCTANADEMNCSLGDIAMGDTVTILVTAQYDGSVPAFPFTTLVINKAEVFFGPIDANLMQIDPELANNDNAAISEAIAPPPDIRFVDLFVVKTDSPDPVVVGMPLSYNINVYNYGDYPAVGVVVTDTLPEGVSVPMGGLPDFCELSDNIVQCTLEAPIPAGGGVVVIPINLLAPEEPGMILNAVHAFAPPLAIDDAIQIDAAPSNNTDSEKTTVVPVPPPSSNLTIIKTDTPDPVIEEALLTYTLFVKNLGPDPAQDVVVYDWLPLEGLDLETFDYTTSPNVAGCTQDPDGLDELNVIECEIPSLGVEESATITMTIMTSALPDGFEFLNIFNLAKVESTGENASADPDPLDNIALESTLIGEFVPVADLSITKSDSPDPVFVGQNLIYSLFVLNSGPDPATNVVVVDTLPANVDLVSVSPDQGACGGLVGNQITCNLGNLASGAFTEVRIEVAPLAGGTILNVAQVMADEHDPNFSNNTSAQTTTVIFNPAPPINDPGGPSGNDLFLLKFVSPNPVEVGNEVLFTLILGNNGGFGSGATVVDQLPAGMTFIEATVNNNADQCVFNEGDNEVECNIGTIPPLGQGDTVVIEVRVRVDITGTLPNIAFLDNVPNDPNTLNNVSIAAVEVVSSTSNPQPPQNPVNPGPVNPGTGGGTNGGDGGSGCNTLAAGPVNTNSTAVNFALMLLPLLVFGIRSIRRKK